MAPRFIAAALAAFAVGATAACSGVGSGRDGVTVFAAASLRDALADVGAIYEEQQGSRVAFSYGGSQALAQQIVRGAPVDVVVSAGAFPVDFLAERGVAMSARTDLLLNRLVVATRAEDEARIGSVQGLADAGVRRVALASPELAPAGRYATEALEALGLWDQVSPKVVRAEDVRAALAYVQTGNADAALVYDTDVRRAKGLVAAAVIPEESHSPIVYVAASLSAAPNAEGAERFLAFLGTEPARRVFREHGFRPVE